jgi:hypothetical protein
LTGILLVALASQAILWTDPGRVSMVDFSRPAGGAAPPAPPFTFLEEPVEGTSAKVLVRDSAGIVWQAKGGPEARAEAFVTRLISALGYFAESTVFIPQGRIEGVRPLRRASGFIQADGTFTWASFERRDPAAKFLPEKRWGWFANPFTGTRELNGLRILMMLVSNWDNKDGSDNRGPNTGVLETGGRYVYFVTDWGQSLGGWGRFFGRSNWNCGDFQRQSAEFVRRMPNGSIVFGYAGQNTNRFRNGITAEDVAWLIQYLGQLTDAQIRVGLLRSGASKEEEECFAAALRDRIERLRRIAAPRAAIR